MGVGKTIQAISLAYIYRDSWPVLIVCPGSMKYLWKGEIRTWLGLKDHRVNIINSSKQKLSTEAYFYIISYDLVKNILKKLKNMTFDFVILDEAHSIKNRDSLRAKNILPIAVRAKRLIIMTGTPLLAKPYEGYPLLYALRPDLFCYFKKYAYRYCDPQPTPFGINWSGTSNTKELHWILSTLMVRRLKRDVLNQLPPKRRQKIFIKTDPNIIEEIKKVRTIKGKKGTLDAYSLTSKAKIEGVYEFIKDLLETEEKFIVFAYHYDMLNRIEELTKEKNIEYIRIDGSTRQDIDMIM
jgi:SWI/SNF-related matrix-associated actin-dependent regulator 1 of chromatin subfamily A